MRRVTIFDHLDNPVGELSTNDIFTCIRREEINGEHSLEITTTQVLEKSQRLVYVDGRGYWHEFVVIGVDEEHASGNRPIGTYYCVWSLQPDLQGVTVSRMPGTTSAVAAGVALDAALSEQNRWTRGTVTNLNTGGASMYDMSAWKALGVLVDNWGGELSTTITVSSTGVASRAVDLYAQQGEQTAKRRFDFGADLRSIKRTMPDEPFYCRISPRGKGELTESGGYGRKIRITEVNDGKDYLQYAPMVDVAKIRDGSSGYQYPTLIVENSDCETPADLLAWAQGVLASTLTPKITYEVNVIQAAAEGVDAHGVSLGDAVDIVDRKFGDSGLRLTGRVSSMVVDELNEREITITIGYVDSGIAGKFSSIGESATKAASMVNSLAENLSTAEYIENLLDRINTEISAQQAWTYILPGNGMRTYDAQVVDPLTDDTAASQIVQIKGGSIQIANTRDAQGNWEFKTLIQSGFIAANMINAANLTAGYIGGSANQSHWDLDANEFVMAIRGNRASATHYVKLGTFAGYNSDGNQRTYRGLKVYSENEKYADGDVSLVAQTGEMWGNSSSGYQSVSGLLAKSRLDIQSFVESNSLGAFLKLRDNMIWMKVRNGTGGLSVGSSSTDVDGNFTVQNGTKSKLVETQNYDSRLLYCYETSAPLFGDIGSGKLDDSGICVVMIDDVFAETVNCGANYQVFLQPCGDGSCHVSEKTAGYFVIDGTPNLEFDWEIKAHQRGFEQTRLEDDELQLSTLLSQEEIPQLDSLYADYQAEIEQLYAEELTVRTVD